MKFLIVSDNFPEFDRNSADFRLSQLMASLLQHGGVDFWAIGEERQRAATGDVETRRYRQNLLDNGITLQEGRLRGVLESSAYDAVIIEWYFSAAPLMEVIRSTQPGARVVTDSVDVTFNRLWAKARVSGLAADREKAAAVQALELDTYRASDLVLSVSDQDAGILAGLDASIRTFTIPNIHPIHEPVDQQGCGKTLVFVGSKSEANDDAMRFFCGDVLPLILAEEPDAVFRAVGTVSKPPFPEHVAPSVEWLGFVPETRPHLESSLISVAPLRYGGGMKGKVGEAMALGLPVVSTTTGAEGFGIVPGRDILVADDAAGFAGAVVNLLRDAPLREQLRMAGWGFIRDNYSDVAVRKRVDALVACINGLEPKRLAPGKKLAMGLKEWWARHVAWRI